MWNTIIGFFFIRKYNENIGTITNSNLAYDDDVKARYS